ncbi:MAG: hypothetical protein ABIF87_04355 [Pseudomonadota bacterium]
MTPKTINFFLVIFTGVIILIQPAFAGNKKIMAIRAAKVIAERAIIESVYGLKLRATEEVKDMIAGNFESKTESKTAANICGIKYEEVVYDAEKDIAKVTASISLDSITNVDGQTLKLKNKVFQRVGFGTSTPANAGPLKALRAAEIDAYTQLIKRIVGFTLESQTTIENFMLKSDEVKTKVIATIYMANIVDFGWDDSGDAFVKMSLNINEVSDMMGERVVGEEGTVEVEGWGTQTDDFNEVQTR